MNRQPPSLGRALLRLARLGDRRDQYDADLRELFDARAVQHGDRHARRRYVGDVASVLIRSWSPVRTSPRSLPLNFMRSVVQDLRFGFRLARRQTGVMLLSVAGMALAIGIDTAFYSLVHANFQPLGVAHPERAVTVSQRLARTAHGGFVVQVDWTYADYLQLRDHVRQMTLEAYETVNDRLSDPTHAVDVPVMVSYVSGGFFSTFGGTSELGRPIAPFDDTLASPPVAVLSDGVWRADFGGDRSILGRTVMVAGSPVTIVGVAAPQFTGLRPGFQAPAVWIALGAASRIDAWLAPYGPSSREYVGVVGELAPGVDRSVAEAEASVVAAALPPAPGGHARASEPANVEPASKPLSVAEALQAAILLGMFASVLVIACANIANVLLASAARRQNEIASRLALGATRARIVRQLLTESLAIGLVAGGCGFQIAVWAVPLLTRLMMVPAGVDVVPDWGVFWFAVASSVLAGVGSGLAAARHGARGDVVSALKGVARGAFDRRPQRARSLLLALEAAVCAALLIVGSLFGRALLRELRSDYGFDDAHFATVSLYVPKDHEGTRLPAFYAGARERLRSLPSVRDVSLVLTPPFARMYLPATLQHEGRRVDVLENRTSANYFREMALAPLRGRTFTDEEERARAPVALVSARVAQTLWGSADPMGAWLEPAGRSLSADVDLSKVQVIGVVRDVVVRPSDPGLGAIYLPIQPDDLKGSAVLWVHTRDDPSAGVRAMRDVVSGLSPDLRVGVTPALDGLEAQLKQAKSGATLVGILGAFGLLLAVFGVFGVTTFVVGQRMPELSVRLALGASPSALVGMLVRETLRPVAVGLAVGVTGTILLDRPLASLVVLSGISPRDPASVATAVLVLASTAVMAALLPALRVARIDPARVLREG
jgi:predicted permease